MRRSAWSGSKTNVRFGPMLPKNSTKILGFCCLIPASGCLTSGSYRIFSVVGQSSGSGLHFRSRDSACEALRRTGPRPLCHARGKPRIGRNFALTSAIRFHSEYARRAGPEKRREEVIPMPPTGIRPFRNRHPKFERRDAASKRPQPLQLGCKSPVISPINRTLTCHF